MLSGYLILVIVPFPVCLLLTVSVPLTPHVSGGLHQSLSVKAPVWIGCLKNSREPQIPNILQSSWLYGKLMPSLRACQCSKSTKFRDVLYYKS